MSKLFRISIAILAVVFMFSAITIAQDGNKKNKKDDKKKPKHTVKQVMGKTMSPKGAKLNKKVIGGTATDAEKLELLDLFISLTENSPPKGDAESWKEFTNSVTMAAARVAVGREGATDELKAATNCKKCHDAHKPAKK